MTAPRSLMDKAANARVAKRRRQEAVFRGASIVAVAIAVAMLGWLFSTVVRSSATAFYQHFITLEVTLDAAALDPSGARDPEQLRRAGYRAPLQQAIEARFPDVVERADQRALFEIISAAGATDTLRRLVYEDPSLVGATVTLTAPVSDDVDQLLKGNIDRKAPELQRPLSDRQIGWIDALVASGESRPRFKTIFFTASDSRDPELAGIAR